MNIATNLICRYLVNIDTNLIYRCIVKELQIAYVGTL